MAHKRILTIQDISCTGRCSITVALPVLSACGVETAIIPTSILSTHTGGFVDYHHRDLTQDMAAIAAHWRTLDLHFDAIYVGFLATPEQVEQTKALITQFKEKDTVVFVDPAMADEGELYSLLPQEFPVHMLGLCQMADVIVPNVTEAYMLLGREYKPGPYDEREMEEILMELARITRAHTLITGVTLDPVNISVIGYDPETQDFSLFSSKRIDGIFYGTGDVFMAALIGCILNDKTMAQSIEIASEYVTNSIESTVAEQADYRYGVNFEQNIPLLLGLLGKLHWS